MAIKSNNQQGNPYHDEATGQFTKKDGGGSSLTNEQQEEHQAMKMFGLENKRKQYPVFGKTLFKKYDIEDQWDAYDSQDENFINEANQIALNQIIAETGYSKEEAIIFHDTLKEYFGGDYRKFKKNMGYDDKISIIDEGLKKMSPYDGNVYRGISFNKIKEQMQFEKIVENLKIGNVLDMGGISSWSSSKKVATGYADLNDHIYGKDYNSILFTVKNNKKGVGMQHVSKFGIGEAEITFPSDSRWKIVNVKLKNRDNFGYTKSIYLVELEEV